jgi:hypothetical protein
MLGIDPKIMTHNIVFAKNTKPVRQKIQNMKPKIVLLVNSKIEKILQYGFIHPIDYSPWISNISVVAKPNSHIRICVDFHDLNKGSLKDEFPLPNIDMIVDLIVLHSLLSFMDGFFGYNQIFINPQDKYKITFTIDWGKNCWVMIPFGLKNVDKKYQRSITLIFHDYIHMILEDYVDDIIAKYVTQKDNVSILQNIFE